MANGNANGNENMNGNDGLMKVIFHVSFEGLNLLESSVNEVRNALTGKENTVSLINLLPIHADGKTYLALVRLSEEANGLAYYVRMIQEGDSMPMVGEEKRFRYEDFRRWAMLRIGAGRPYTLECKVQD